MAVGLGWREPEAAPVTAHRGPPIGENLQHVANWRLGQACPDTDFGFLGHRKKPSNTPLNFAWSPVRHRDIFEAIGPHVHTEPRELARDAEAQRDAGHDKLFPELKRDRRGYYSDPFQKWFSRFLGKAGAKAPRTSFHSFRHNFRDALREADVSREATLALGGWAGQGVADTVYGGGLRPSTLAREIRKVRYEGLDLRHLHTR